MNTPQGQPSHNQADQTDQPTGGQAAMPLFVQAIDDAQGRIMASRDLTDSGLKVGYLDDNDLQIDAKDVSRYHLRIARDGAMAQVTDLGSRNGTLFAGVPMQPNIAQRWQIGQVVRIGSIRLRLAQGSSAEAQSASDQQRTASASIVFDPEAENLHLTPGLVTAVKLTLHNHRPASIKQLLEIEGIPAAWVDVPNYPITLPPGGQASVGLNINVPEDASSYAGTYDVVLRARSEQDLRDWATAEARWTVAAFVGTHAELQPPRARGWRSAVYNVVIKNGGNAPVTCLLEAEDDKLELVYEFVQKQIVVAPGDVARVKLTVYAPERALREVLSRAFQIHVRPSGEKPITIPGTFLQHPPSLAPWVPAIVAGLFILAAALFLRFSSDSNASTAPTATPGTTAQPTSVAATAPQNLPTSTISITDSVNATTAAQNQAAEAQAIVAERTAAVLYKTDIAAAQAALASTIEAGRTELAAVQLTAAAVSRGADNAVGTSVAGAALVAEIASAQAAQVAANQAAEAAQAEVASAVAVQVQQTIEAQAAAQAAQAEQKAAEAGQTAANQASQTAAAQTAAAQTITAQATQTAVAQTATTQASQTAVMLTKTAEATGTTAASQTAEAGRPVKLRIELGTNLAQVGVPIAPEVKVYLVDRMGNQAPVSGVLITVGLTKNDNKTITLNGSTTETAQNGVATFTNLNITKTGTYTLVANSESLPSVTSTALTIQPGTVARLDFTQGGQPNESVQAGKSFDIAIQAIDSFNNIVTAYQDTTITVTLSRDTQNNLEVGSGTATFVDGVAKLRDLSVRKAGENYNLLVKGQNDLVAVSKPFEITAALADHLAFVTKIPDTVSSGETFAVTARLVDGFGNTVKNPRGIQAKLTLYACSSEEPVECTGEAKNTLQGDRERSIDQSGEVTFDLKVIKAMQNSDAKNALKLSSQPNNDNTLPGRRDNETSNVFTVE